MPLGVGSLIYVANVLPFAYVLWAMPFGPRRWLILGMTHSQNNKWYYKRWWARMFFGRAQYTFYTLIAAFQLGKYIRGEDAHQTYFRAFYHDFDMFDAEESDNAKRILDKYVYTKRLNQTRDVVLQQRAEKDRELKIQAFDKYASENHL
jgi:hypothetical protein